MASPILYSWVNRTLANNYGERGLIISSMMTFGFCTQIWVPMFTFPTVEAPRFPNGYPAASVFEFSMWATLMTGVWYMKHWKAKHPDPEPIVGTGEVGEASSTELESQTVKIGAEKLGGKIETTGLVRSYAKHMRPIFQTKRVLMDHQN